MVDCEVPFEKNDFGISYLSNTAAFGVGTPDKTIKGSTLINDGKWHYIAVTRQKTSGTMKLYIDGNLETTGTGATNSLTDAVRMAFGSQEPLVGFFNGAMDEIQISSIVRPDAWIKMSYQNQKPSAPTSAPMLQYQQSEITINMSELLDPAISPVASLEDIDSVTIAPALPDFLVFDPFSGMISGWASDSMAKATYIVKAWNSVGATADTITIRVIDPSTASLKQTIATATVPTLTGIRRGPAGAGLSLLYTVPSQNAARELILNGYNLQGSTIWSARISASQLTAGTHVLPIGNAIANGVYFVKMTTVLNNGKAMQSKACKVTAVK
jgi:hypothetical protein